MTRQLFVSLLMLAVSCTSRPDGKIMTVTGEITTSQLGKTLAHEHILTDINRQSDNLPESYQAEEVVTRVKPELEKLKAYGVRTLVECTPSFLGKDVRLLKRLSEETGIQILTNTGYYGAQNNRFIPSEVLLMSAEELAQIWIAEFERGIDGTGIKPGFIKIGVDPRPLSEFHATLVRAAALTHKKTGLTIMSHTGPAIPALQELEILKAEGVSPEAFIWTHATNEKDSARLVQIAKMGAWVSADNYGWGENMIEEFPRLLKLMKKEGVLHKMLISHDAGWYDPGQPEQPFKPYTAIFDELIPNLKMQGFSDADIELLLVKNPAEAFSVRKRFILPDLSGK